MISIGQELRDNKFLFVYLLRRALFRLFDCAQQYELPAIESVIVNSATLLASTTGKHYQTAVQPVAERIFHFQRPAAEGKRKPINLACPGINEERPLRKLRHIPRSSGRNGRQNLPSLLRRSVAVCEIAVRRRCGSEAEQFFRDTPGHDNPQTSARARHFDPGLNRQMPAAKTRRES